MSESTKDLFDRAMGALHGRPDVTASRPATVQAVSPLLGEMQTFIVQTCRERDKGDTIFLQYIAGGNSFRIMLPPAVSAAIARQRDAISGKVRSKAGREAAEKRMAEGWDPAAQLRGRR